MSKRNKIIYWVATIWLSLAMVASGIQQIFNIGEFIEVMEHLGYPSYFWCLLGCWKILGVVALLIPKKPLLKEWAYAGFFFAMSGALFSHIASGDQLTESFPSLFILFLIIVSWYFRPIDKKFIHTPA